MFPVLSYSIGRVCAFTSLLLICVACSSGTGDGANEGAGVSEDSGISTGGDTPVAGTSQWTFLPFFDNQPNTVSPDIAVDSAGNLHAVYSDIDARVLYGFCSSSCSDRNSWTSVEITSFDIDSITGAATTRLLIDRNNEVHIAIAVNSGGSGIFSTQAVSYASCAASCLNAASWSVGLAFQLNRAILESDLQAHDWFALTAGGSPRLSFIDPDGALGDEFLWYFACDTDCSRASNWTRTVVTELNLASNVPATLLIGSDNRPMIVTPYQVIATDNAQLLYIECESDCDSTSPTWSTPITLATVRQELFDRDAYDATLADDRPVIAVTRDSSPFDLSLLTCAQNCSNLNAWSLNDIGSRLPVPSSVASLASAVAVSYNDGVVSLGLIGKDRSTSLPNRIMQFSCAGTCASNQWTYQTLADTSTLRLEDQGICQFIGTAAEPPLRLAPGSFAFEASPQWACGTGPVEVTDADGNVFIDNNADIRFLEFASFGLSD